MLPLAYSDVESAIITIFTQSKTADQVVILLLNMFKIKYIEMLIVDAFKKIKIVNVEVFGLGLPEKSGQ